MNQRERDIAQGLVDMLDGEVLEAYDINASGALGGLILTSGDRRIMVTIEAAELPSDTKGST